MSRGNYQIIGKECLFFTDIYNKDYGKGAVNMRINSMNRIYDTYSAQAAVPVKRTSKTQAKDEVDFTNQAKDFASIKKMLEGTPEVREELVQDIKERMNNGTYKTSSSEVASKILSQYNFGR